ncbi:MAG TPA: SDR family oxidoreductase [Isosphaeraceae bacterium]|nr:SDR family oxidoreductase [Isosphaeraceae bacterium]
MPGHGRLEGKACLIVGGTGGIGAAAAGRFAEEGARVVVAGLGGTDGAISVDVADAGQVRGMVAEAVGRLGGRLDVLLHVAGISGRRYGDGSLHECSDEGWERVLAVNARGAFLTNREAVRVMLGQGPDDRGVRGAIVNVGSVLAERPAPGHFDTIAYAASKGALRSLTLAAAARYAPDRIRFNLLVPGLIDTPMAARAVGDPAIRAFLARKQGLAGGPCAAGDVAEAALALCESSARFVTGAELVVDGGWSVGEASP